VAQVELHLLLSGAPFLQVLIHHVVKGDGSLWRGENIRRSTLKQQTMHSDIRKVINIVFCSSGKKAGKKTEW